uniref:Uncharacterized protein n=1 Tax=Leersia perrieri TaxID=77586 RepID=A0A0D9XUQ7_9ORYZ
MTTISAGGGRKAVRYLLTASCMRQLRTQDAIAQGRKTKFLIRDSIVLLGAAGEAADYWRLGILLLTQAMMVNREMTRGNIVKKAMAQLGAVMC